MGVLNEKRCKEMQNKYKTNIKQIYKRNLLNCDYNGIGKASFILFFGNK